MTDIKSINFFKLFSIVVIILWGGCVRERLNPLDVHNPTYENPGIRNIEGLSVTAIDTVTGDSVSVIVGRGNPSKTKYRFLLDSNQWSAWDTVAHFKAYNLDEGEHFVVVQTKYVSGVVSEPETLSFFTDAIKGPALLLENRFINVSAEDTFRINIGLEEALNIAFVNVRVKYNPLSFKFITVNYLDTFSKSSMSFFDTSNGLINISSILPPSVSAGVSGTNTFAEVVFIAHKSDSLIIDDSCSFRDNLNTPITISKIRGTYVRVE